MFNRILNLPLARGAYFSHHIDKADGGIFCHELAIF